MVEIPLEISNILKLIDNGMIWLIIALFFVFSYLLVSLLTWSFIKPLKYLGIPTIIVGALFLTIRIVSSVLISFIKLTPELNIIKTLLPSVLMPILIYSIVCIVLGIGMLVLYGIINKKTKKKHYEEKTETKTVTV